MSTFVEKLVEDLVLIVAPLEADALQAVVVLVKTLVSHPDGAELAAKRQTEALAAEAAIRT